MNTLVLHLNEILGKWHDHHDLSTDDRPFFHAAQNQLCFAGYPICPMAGLSLVHAEFSSDEIEYTMNDGRSILLTFQWPEDDNPVVASVSFIQRLIG